MAKYLLDASGKWVDEKGQQAAVKSTRHLAQDDKFEEVVGGKKRTLQVVEKTITEDGHLIVRSVEVNS